MQASASNNDTGMRSTLEHSSDTDQIDNKQKALCFATCQLTPTTKPNPSNGGKCRRNPFQLMDNSGYEYSEPRTTRLPMIIVVRKNGTQWKPQQCMQSQVNSIHSPHRTRNTIMNEWRKSWKFQRGISSGKYCSL